MPNVYQVTVLANRGREVVSEVRLYSLTVATKQFQQEAGKVIQDLDSAVLLSLKTGPSSGTTLAAKSTDGVHVEFHQAYYRLLSPHN